MNLRPHIYLFVSKPQLMALALILSLTLLCGTLANTLRSNHLPWDWQSNDDSVYTFENFEELDQKMATGTILVDARPSSLFRLGHIPGAISLPTEEAGVRLLDWLKDKHKTDIVVYCSEPLCPLAAGLANLIMAQGHDNVSVFSPGFDGWLTANRPVALD